MKKRLSLWALPVCFLLILGIFTVCFFVMPKKTYAENEKRILSESRRFRLRR